MNTEIETYFFAEKNGFSNNYFIPCTKIFIEKRRNFKGTSYAMRVKQYIGKFP